MYYRHTIKNIPIKNSTTVGRGPKNIPGEIIPMLTNDLFTPICKQIPSIFLLFGFVVALAPTLSFADINFDCEPVQIIERSNRVGVKCLYPYAAGSDALAIDWVYFITFPKTDRAQMERFLSFATTAIVEDKHFSVDVPSEGDDNINGCNLNNCRTVSTPFALRNK